MKPSQEVTVAIVIVGYKSRSDLEECLSSLKKSTFQDFQIIFVDNHSEDGSLELVKKNYPQAAAIPAKENLGFAAGNNLGLAVALKGSFSYVFLLNPDTTVAPDCLAELMAAANPKTILQPLILLNQKGQPTTLVNTAGNSLSYLGFSYCGGYLEEAAQFTQQVPITVASGAGALIPVEVFRTVGLFDPVYFMYHEDVDLSWRARKAGFELLLIPTAKLWHKYSFSRNNTKFFYSERNRLLFISKNFGAPLLLLTLPFHLLNELLLCLYATASGWLPAKLRSYLSFFKLLPDTLRQRQEWKSKQVCSDHQLKYLLSDTIGFSEVKVPLLEVYNLFAKGYWLLIRWLI